MADVEKRDLGPPEREQRLTAWSDGGRGVAARGRAPHGARGSPDWHGPVRPQGRAGNCWAKTRWPAPWPSSTFVLRVGLVEEFAEVEKEPGRVPGAAACHRGVPPPPRPRRPSARRQAEELTAIRAKREVRRSGATGKFTERVAPEDPGAHLDRPPLRREGGRAGAPRDGEGGHPLGKRIRARGVLKAWRDQFGYTEDPFDAEGLIAKARDVMRLPGHDYLPHRRRLPRKQASSLLSEMSCVGSRWRCILVTFLARGRRSAAAVCHGRGARREDGWVRFRSFVLRRSRAR